MIIKAKTKIKARTLENLRKDKSLSENNVGFLKDLNGRYFNHLMIGKTLSFNEDIEVNKDTVLVYDGWNYEPWMLDLTFNKNNMSIE